MALSLCAASPMMQSVGGVNGGMTQLLYTINTVKCLGFSAGQPKELVIQNRLYVYISGYPNKLVGKLLCRAGFI